MVFLCPELGPWCYSLQHLLKRQEISKPLHHFHSLSLFCHFSLSILYQSLYSLHSILHQPHVPFPLISKSFDLLVPWFQALFVSFSPPLSIAFLALLIWPSLSFSASLSIETTARWRLSNYRGDWGPEWLPHFNVRARALNISSVHSGGSMHNQRSKEMRLCQKDTDVGKKTLKGPFHTFQ